jgi:multicomponent Na+:H+ antiporter subunit E
VARLGLLSALWWALNLGELDSWIVGLPVVALAAWVATQLTTALHWRVQLRGLLQFLPFFLLTSLRGGADVAWRALHPRLPIEPVLLHYPLRLRNGTARTFLVNVVNLLPGTLSADLKASGLVLHVLNDPGSAARGLAVLEGHVAALFGVDLENERVASP